MRISLSRAATGARLYPPVIRLRQVACTFSRERSFERATRVLHSCEVYVMVALTVAVYSRRVFRTDGPQVEVASLASASEATIPLRDACAMCSPHESFGSSYTPRSLTFSSLLM